jgi:hypothetical protein
MPTLRPLSGGRWLLVANEQHTVCGSMEEGLNAAASQLPTGTALQLMDYLGEPQRIHTVAPQAQPAAEIAPKPKPQQPAELRPTLPDTPGEHKTLLRGPEQHFDQAAAQRPIATQQVRSEFERAEKVVEHTKEHVWPLLLLLLGPSVAYGLIAPEIIEAGSFFGAFLATLAWSGGFAVCVALLIHGLLNRVGGMGAMLTCSVVLLASALVASAAGYGAYKETVILPNGPPPSWIVSFAEMAIASYGVGGFFIACAIGGLAGRWLAKLWSGWS